jgi:hypothetical protein
MTRTSNATGFVSGVAPGAERIFAGGTRLKRFLCLKGPDFLDKRLKIDDLSLLGPAVG